MGRVGEGKGKRNQYNALPTCGKFLLTEISYLGGFVRDKSFCLCYPNPPATFFVSCLFFFFFSCRSLSITGRNYTFLHELRGMGMRKKGKKGKVEKERHVLWPG